MFPSTVLSKEREKEKALSFTIGKLSGSATVSVLICNEGGQKEKTFLSQYQKGSISSAPKNDVPVPRPSNSKQPSQPSQGDGKVKTIEVEEKVKVTEEKQEANQSFEDEDDIIKDEPSEKKTLKSEVLRKSLKINYTDFTFNTTCKRCNYLERLIQAQQNDIKILQNQIECFMKGNFENPNKEPEVLESESLLKEPVFNKIFNEATSFNVTQTSEGGEPQKVAGPEESKTSSSKKVVQKSNSIKTPADTKDIKASAEKEKTKAVFQKPGEAVDIYMLDDNREKRIQKYEQEIDNLKAQIFAIMKQKKGLEFIKIENESLRAQITRAETIRIQLEEKLIENNSLYQNKLDNALNDLNKAFKERRVAEERLSRFEIDFNNLKTENELNMKKLRELDQKLVTNLANADQLKNVRETINALKEDFSRQEKTKINYQDDFRRNLSEMNSKLEDLKRENTKLNTENNVLSAKIKELENTIHAKSRDLVDKQKRIVDLEAAIVSFKSEQISLNEVIKHRDELTAKFNRIMEINYNLNEDISKLNSSYSEQNSILQDKINILQNANNNLKAAVENREREINVQKNTINGIIMFTQKTKLKLRN